MSRRRRYYIYILLVLLGVIAGLGGIVGNVASSALLATWSPHLWLAWLLGILTIAGIVIAICQARIEDPNAGRVCGWLADLGPAGESAAQE